MASPTVEYSFDDHRGYLSSRTGGAPGSGIWSAPTKFFQVPNDENDAGYGGFSAGYSPTSDGILVAQFQDLGLTFCANGLPSTALPITYPGPETPGLLLNNNPGRVGFLQTSQGAFLVGSAYYIVTPPPDGSNIFSVLKSTNSGTSWVNMDSAHRPTGFVDKVLVQFANGKIYLFIASDFAHQNWSIVAFDTATDTWGSPFADLFASNPITSFIVPLSGGGAPTHLWSNGLIVYANGDIGIFYTDSAPNYQLWNGSSWGSQIPLPTASSGLANIAKDESLESNHVLGYANGSGKVDYCLVAHNGTITTSSATIPAPVGSSDGVGRCRAQNGMLFVPRNDSNNGGPPSVWVASIPVASFSQELLSVPSGENNQINTSSVHSNGSGYAHFDTGTINGGVIPAYYFIQSVAGSGAPSGVGLTSIGTGYTAITENTTRGGAQPGSGSGLQLNILTVNGSGGILTFSINVPGTGYAIGDTGTVNGGGGNAAYQITSLYPLGAVLAFGIDNYSGGDYSTGSNIATTNGGNQPGVGTGFTVNILSVEQKNPSGNYMLGDPSESPPPPTPPILTCPGPLTLTIGVPYAGPGFVAWSGTPPYNITATGLPPGLSVNPLTGAITGTPTALGTFSYTGMVTDANGLTANASCGPFLVVMSPPSNCPPIVLTGSCSPIR